MNRISILTFFVLSILGPININAQLPQNCNTQDHLLIMGDSWAQYMYDDNVYNSSLDAYGHADKTMRSDVFEVSLFDGTPDPQGSYYAVSGSLAREWVDESTFAFLQNVRDELIANPKISIVVLSIGGNDVLAGQSDCGWYKNMDQDPDLATRGCGYTNETEFFDLLEANTQFIIDEILNVRPDIEVVISSYDYPNFNVTTFWLGCLCDLCDQYACPKRYDLSFDLNNNGSIDGNELITDAEINQMMIDTELRRQAIADANPRIFYDNSMGLTQYTYGYNGNSGGTTSAPTGAPLYTPGGDANYPTDRDNFRLVDIPLWFDAPADPIHLTSGTYSYKVKNQLDHIIFEKIRGLEDEINHITLWSEGYNDGYIDILEDGVFNSGLRMGDEDTGFASLDNDYRSILSFETSSIPDNATITGGSIYIIRSSEEDNPFLHSDRDPVLDIKSGYFGSSPSLELADGTESADGTNIGCFVGDATTNKYAIRIDLDPAALTHVNTLGKTQFRLYFDYADWSDEYINFYDGQGNAGLTPPSEEIRNNKKTYKEYTRTKTPNLQGDYDINVLDKTDIIQPREGYVFEELIIDIKTDDNGVVTERIRTVLVVEHTGLAKYMLDNFSAPASGLAPFIDITYDLPLPLELTDFKVTKDKNIAILDWHVSQVESFSHFEIEHSLDAIIWKKIGREAYITDKDHYTFNHDNLVIGSHYYRLKMVDYSSEFSYSDIRSIIIIDTESKLDVFPNPFEDKLSFKFNSTKEDDLYINIIDILGKSVINKVIHINQISGQIDLNVEHLGAGIYFAKILLNGKSYSYKMVKE